MFSSIDVSPWQQLQNILVFFSFFHSFLSFFCLSSLSGSFRVELTAEKNIRMRAFHCIFLFLLLLPKIKLNSERKGKRTFLRFQTIFFISWDMKNSKSYQHRIKIYIIEEWKEMENERLIKALESRRCRFLHWIFWIVMGIFLSSSIARIHVTLTRHLHYFIFTFFTIFSMFFQVFFFLENAILFHSWTIVDIFS